jgi:hypothetical protein
LRLFAAALALCAAAAAPVFAQNTAAPPRRPAPWDNEELPPPRVPIRTERFFADIGASVWTGFGGNSTTFAGANLNGGFYLFPNDRLMLGVGFGFEPSPEKKSFADSGADEAGDWVDAQWNTKLTRTLIPVMFSWEHQWWPTERLSLRLGPTVGAAWLSGERKINLTARFNNEPDTYSASSSANADAVAFLFGGTAGLRWDFVKTQTTAVYADLTVSAFGATNAKLKFKDDFGASKTDLSGLRLNLAIGLTF